MNIENVRLSFNELIGRAYPTVNLAFCSLVGQTHSLTQPTPH